MSLRTKITALHSAISAKINELYTLAEKKINKRQDLLSNSPDDYASIPAIKAGLTATENAAANYTDQKFGTLPPNLVSDEDYVHTDNNFTDERRDKLDGLEGSKFKGAYLSEAELLAAHPGGQEGWYADVDIPNPDYDAQDPESDETITARYIWSVSNGQWQKNLGASTQLTNAQVKQLYGENPDTEHLTTAEKASIASNSNHRERTDNPHGVTKEQVGLANVDNTSDVNKPVSTAQGTAINLVQTNLNNYKAEVGENFPDYAAQFNAEVNF